MKHNLKTLGAAALLFGAMTLPPQTANAGEIKCAGKVWGHHVGQTVEVHDRRNKVDSDVRYKAKIGECTRLGGTVKIIDEDWWPNKPSKATMEKRFGVSLSPHSGFRSSGRIIGAYKVR